MMKAITIRNEYITLGQFLKYVGIVSSGIEAKAMIKDGLIKVNGEIETRRGKKLRNDDQIQYEEDIYLIHANQ